MILNGNSVLNYILSYMKIIFSFLIGGDGRVYEGRGFGVKPSNDEYIKKMYPLVEDTLDIAYITTLESTYDLTPKNIKGAV